MSNHLSGFTSLELLTKSKADHCNLPRFHMWGCPAIVIDTKLQNNQQLPKWNLHNCVGKFWGYLNEHLSLVANVHHLSTGHVLPQFHVVFGDLFETVVCNGDNGTVVKSVCDVSFNWNCNFYVEDEFDANYVLIYNPPLPIT